MIGIGMTPSKFADASRVRIGLYVRVSTDEQVHTRQIQGIDMWLKSLPKNFKVVASYEEKATGRDVKKRPKFNEMMSALRANQFDVIVAYSMDRFARSTKDFLQSVELIKKFNKEVHLIKENLTISNDDSNPYQVLMATIFSAFAQFESDLISDRTREGMAGKKKENPFTTYGQAPKIGPIQTKQVIAMYYKRCKPSRLRDYRRRGPRFVYSVQQIADSVGVTKGGISQWLQRRAKAGLIKLRSPEMARELTKDTIAGLDIPEEAPVEVPEKEMRKLLDYRLWPAEVRAKISDKFGNGFMKKSPKQTRMAYEFGRKLYIEWLQDQTSLAMHTAVLNSLDEEDEAKFLATFEYEVKDSDMSPLPSDIE